MGNLYDVDAITGDITTAGSITAGGGISSTSTTEGFLPPVMTTTQKNAIVSPATGLIVYDSTLNSLQEWNGTAWVGIGSPAGVDGDIQFNNAGVFGGLAGITTDGINLTISENAGTGGSLTLTSNDQNAPVGGGSITLTTGSSTVNGALAGGSITLTTGNDGTNGPVVGGNLTLTTGNTDTGSGSSAIGGSITLTTGTNAGTGATQGGGIILTTGSGAGSVIGGNIVLTANTPANGGNLVLTGTNVGQGNISANNTTLTGLLTTPAIQITTTPTAGFVLTSDATGVGTWQAASVTPAGGVNGDLQYNNAGAIDGATGITTDGTNLTVNGDLTVATPNNSGAGEINFTSFVSYGGPSFGPDVTFSCADVAGGGLSTNGPAVTITSGISANSNTTGGSLTLTTSATGPGGTAMSGGSIVITTGTSTAASAEALGGSLVLTTGDCIPGFRTVGGGIVLTSGQASTNSGGNITLTSFTPANGGNITLTGTGASHGNISANAGNFVNVNASAGMVTPALQITTAPTAGFVLTSDASGNGTWQVGGGVSSLNTFTGAVAVTAGSGIVITEAAANAVTNYALTAGSQPLGCCAGPDGNVWFCFNTSSLIAKVTPAGVITTYPTLTPNATPTAICLGPDGNLWFTENGANNIGRITPSGVVTEFPVTTSAAGLPGICVGGDGNLWFTEQAVSQIGVMTTTGVMVNEYPTVTPSAGVIGICLGSDGNVWFCEDSANNIAQITPSGVVTEFPITTPTSGAYGICTGADGNLWFGEIGANQIGVMSTAGAMLHEYPCGLGPVFTCLGPDGNVWFTESGVNEIAKITPAGVVTSFSGPMGSANLNFICAGPDGNIWFSQQFADYIGKIVPTNSVVVSAISSTGGANTSLSNLAATAINASLIPGVDATYNLGDGSTPLRWNSVFAVDIDTSAIYDPTHTLQVVTIINDDPAWIFNVAPELSNNRITGVADPVAPQDAATKNYVDTHSSSNSVTTVTTTATAGAFNIIQADATAGAFTITLPAAASSANAEYTIKKIDSSANAVTLQGNGVETIDGSNTQLLNVQWSSLTVVCNGTSWIII